MRTPIRFFIALLIPIIFMVGCSDDIRQTDVSRPSADGIRLSYSVANLYTRGKTSPASESVISDAYLLFFSDSGNFVASVHALKDSDNPECLKFDLPEGLKENTTYSLVALANADEFTPSGFSNYSSYLESFTETPLTQNDSRLLLQFGSPMTPTTISLLPMKGNADFSFSNTPTGVKINSAIRFERIVARIDLINAVKEGFEIQGVGLCNWRDSYSPLVEGNNAAGKLNGILSKDGEICIFEDFPSGENAEKVSLAPAFYCFPSSSEKAAPGDETTTALLLKARYSLDEAPSFYRVNIGESGLPTELRGNYCHRISINSVKGSGKPTAKEAYESKEDSPVEDTDLSIEPIPDAADYSHLVSFELATPTAHGKIVIDGFEPESFNSFIDLKFSVKATETSASDLSVVTDMEWPLEGSLSSEPYKKKYFYCPESFTDKSVVDESNTFTTPATFTLPEDKTFYISVGAMAPDDPAIKRTLTLSSGENKVVYDLEIRPRPVIINDIVFTDSKGTINIICDRNYQVYESYGCTVYEENKTTCWNSDGTKKQAYHYNSYTPMKIPFKTSSDLSENDNIANETYHSVMHGYTTKYSKRQEFKTKNGQWKNINKYEKDNCQSPFYTSSKIESWGHMRSLLFKEIAGRMKVSKMRMFLISEVPAKDNEISIPICCYFPYDNKDSSSMTYDISNPRGFYTSTTFIKLNGGEPGQCRIIRCNNIEVEVIEVTSTSLFEGCVRPVIEITQEDLNNYKDNCLGYKTGTKPRLSPCVPDTRP